MLRIHMLANHVTRDSALAQYTKCTNLNKSIDRKIILNTYTDYCIPQMGIYIVTIINNGIEF